MLRRHPHVHVISDDIYEHLTYDAFRFATLAAVAPDLHDRILTVNGVSKSYCMTGWRIGYGAGPTPLIKAMAKVQSQSTSVRIQSLQYAAIAAMMGTIYDADRTALRGSGVLCAMRLTRLTASIARCRMGRLCLSVDCRPDRSP